MDTVGLLVEILLDVHARIDERDDAAIDLGKYYDDDRALDALLTIVLNPNAEPFILDVCGESIGEIWVQRDHFAVDLYKRMPSVVQREIYACVKKNKPEWIEVYKLSLNER